MSDIDQLSYADFKIPASLVSKTDVARLVAEAERVDSMLVSIDVHNKIEIGQQIDSTMAQSLQDFLSMNELSFDDSNHRTKIIQELRRLKDKVPIIHLTFAAEADRESLEKLSAWLRESIHPQAVIAAGLQPSLVAGVYVRTANKVFDKSIRSKLKDGRHFLIEELEALSGK